MIRLIKCMVMAAHTPLSDMLCAAWLLYFLAAMQDKKDEACKKCSLRFLTCDATYHKKSICNAEHKPKTLQPPFKLRPWEKQLRNQRPPSSADDIAALMAEGKKFEQQYRKSLPSRGESAHSRCRSRPWNAATRRRGVTVQWGVA